MAIWTGLWDSFKVLEQAWIDLQQLLQTEAEFTFRFQIRGVELHLGRLRIEDEKLSKVLGFAVDKVNDEIANIEALALTATQVGTSVTVAVPGIATLLGPDILIDPLKSHTILRNTIPMTPGTYTIDNPAGEILSGLFNPGDLVQAIDYYPESSYEVPGPDKAGQPYAAYEQLPLRDNILLLRKLVSGRERPSVDFDVNIDANPLKVKIHNIEIGDRITADYIPKVGPTGPPEICEGIFRISETGSPEEFTATTEPDFTFELGYEPKVQEDAPTDPYAEITAEPDTRVPKDWVVRQTTYDEVGRLYYDGRPQGEGGDVPPGSDLATLYDGHYKMNKQRERLVGGTRRMRNACAWAKAQIQEQIQDLIDRNGIFEDIKNA